MVAGSGLERTGEPVRLVRVVPDVPAIHRRFDYSVPPRMDSEVRIGSRVRIELHGRRVGGWVVEDGVPPTPGVVAKPLAASSGEGPPAEVVALAEWAAWRWAGPLSSFLGTASPLRVVRAGAIGAPGGRSRMSDEGGRRPGDGPDSPGGGSVSVVDQVLGVAPSCSVVRLAPALDAVLVVMEVLHRVGPAGVLVLAPSRARAHQVATRLQAAGLAVAVLPEAWAEASKGDRTVVGTRAAAWAPLRRLKAAVVLDAHDEAYREERSPTWSAVEVVVERGRRDQAPVALVSPCPTVVMTEGRPLVTTTRAAEHRGWPSVEVVDRTADDPRTGLFSEMLVTRVRSALDRPDGRAVAVLNRTGRIRLLACAHCSSLVRCTRCGGAMAQEERGGSLRCRRCSEHRPQVCAVCDSSRLRFLRVGVTRATEELSALTKTEAVEMSGPSGGVEGDARLVVGTEAALHRVSRADVVAFLDFDQHLLAPRFAAAEEALALLARAARLVGTRDGSGRLLVQTRIPDHEVLRAALHADPQRMSVPERDLRRSLRLPPFGALALLGGPGGASFADELATAEGITVSATGRDRWLVRGPNHRVLCDALAGTERPAERLRVEVDPSDV